MKRIISLLFVFLFLFLIGFKKTNIKVNAEEAPSLIPAACFDQTAGYGKSSSYSKGTICADLFNSDKSINYANDGSILSYTDTETLSLDFACYNYYYNEKNYSIKITARNVNLKIVNSVSGEEVETSDVFENNSLGVRASGNSLNSNFPKYDITITKPDSTTDSAGELVIEISLELEDYSTTSKIITLPLLYTTEKISDSGNTFGLLGYVTSGAYEDFESDSKVLINKDLFSCLDTRCDDYIRGDIEFTEEVISSNTSIINITKGKREDTLNFLGKGICNVTKNIYINYTIDGISYKTFYKSTNINIYVYESSDIKIYINNKLPETSYTATTDLEITYETTIPKEYLKDITIKVVDQDKLKEDSRYSDDQAYYYINEENTIFSNSLSEKELFYINLEKNSSKNYGVVLYDNLCNTIYYNSTTIIFSSFFKVDTEEVNVKPQTIEFTNDYEEIVFDNYQDKAYVDIVNYELLKKYYQLNIIVSGTNTAEIIDGKIEILCRTQEITVITVVAFNENTSISNTVTVSLRKRITNYAFSEDELILYSNGVSTKSVSIGYMDNGAFKNLDTQVLTITYYTKNNYVNVLRGDNDYTFSITSLIKNGNDVLYVVINNTNVISLNIIVKEMDIKQTTNVEFAQGSILSILLDSKDNYVSIESIPNSTFEFISLNNGVATVELVGVNKAKVIATGIGETTILGFYNADNGDSYIAQIQINVINEKPKLGIISENAVAEGIINEEDDALIKLDTGGFHFQEGTTYVWYLDDALLEMDKVKVIDDYSFMIKLTSGEHTFKCMVNDPKQNIQCDAEQKVIVSKERRDERVLSLDYEDVIYLDINGKNFEINVLLDGVSVPSYKYKWSFSNDIAEIKIDGNEKILIAPKSVGKTTLTVMTNIGKTSDNYLTAKIEINIINVNEITLVANERLLPNKKGVIEVLANNEHVANLDLMIDVTYEKAVVKNYTYKNGYLTFDNLEKGKYKVNVNCNFISEEQTFNVTNIDIVAVGKAIIPYLVVILCFLIFIVMVTKKQKPEFTKLEHALEKYKDKVDNAKDQEKNVKTLNKLLKATDHVNKKVNYLIDQDIDELTLIKTDLDKIHQIIYAAIKVNASSDKIEKIIIHISKKDVPKILGEYESIKKERESYEQMRKETEETPFKKQKKTKEEIDAEYIKYIDQSGYMEDSSDDSSDDESN